VRLENTFDVAASLDQAWELLNDIPRVIPCMPGTELLEVVDADHFVALAHVKLGPIALKFSTALAREETREDDHTVRLSANARELKGRGSATAEIVSSLTPTATETQVSVTTDLELTGTIAQYGRGIVADVAAQLTKSFASALERELGRSHSDEPGDPTLQASRPAIPVSGLRLTLGAFLRAVLRPFRRAS
jgi:hypothetical protein